MTNYTNLININEENIQATLNSLQNEKFDILKKLGEIYAEEARLKFIQDSLSVTSSFVSKSPKALQMPPHSGDLVGSEISISGLQSKENPSTPSETWKE